ncbi:MAG: hypothetical protein JO142_00380 [Burkholderiales bacterium]|nr:hypothetical protein [Burkholderiales bacterium]
MKSGRILIVGICIAYARPSLALDIDGFVDLRAGTSTTDQSWAYGGLGKLRTDRDHDGLSIGQADLILRGDVSDTISGNLTLNAASEHKPRIDVTEAWLKWRPIPASAWRTTVRAGAFFPPGSFENDGPGWSTSRTLSASAINSWIGEEIRIKGLELDLFRSGRFANSVHDFGVTAGAFNGNEPAGALLAWRGWSIGDRITGLTETLPLPNLPIYDDDGPLYDRQQPRLDDFHQIDNRVGYYASTRYSYGGNATLMLTHYENRGNPKALKHGQYAWDTRYDETSAKWSPTADSELIAQAMTGMTMMGYDTVRINFEAWFLLADYRWGKDMLAARYDHFRTRQNDQFPQDNNDEDGHAVTVAWTHDLSEDMSVVGEWVQLNSTRPERTVFGISPSQRERSVQIALRWRFD